MSGDRCKTLVIVGGGLAAAAGLLMLPGAWKMRGRGPCELNGVTTLDDATTACRRTGLAGWDLVLYAQRLVYDKFAFYSLRNGWDTPARAFARGMGYCTHYNLALGQLLERLGFDVEPVFSLRIRVFDDPDWTMGHTWLRVTLGGETLDVCAGHENNRPGEVGFSPLAPVLHGNQVIFFLTNLGLILFSGFLDWKALLTGQPPPSWMFMAQPRRR